MGESGINKAMKEAVADGVFPSAELLVSKKGETVFHEYFGGARKGTCFDIASLTKPMCTATLSMFLVAEKLLKLEDTVYDWLGGARQPVHKKMTVEMLLRHSSGLPAWQPYYRELPVSFVGTESGKKFILDACYQEPLTFEPGKSEVYSDIGYIMLGEIVAECGGENLDALFSQMIANPLGLHDSFFVQNVGSPISMSKRHTDTTADQHVPTPKFGYSNKQKDKNERRRFAPTEDCPWRERVVHGEVHDQNAYALGGIAGHAGLFSVGEDINRFISAIVKSYRGDDSFLPSKIVKKFLDAKIDGREFVLGFDTPSIKNSQAGQYFSRNSVGHLGFSGCSMWVDLAKDFWIILLSNRIHPTSTNEKIQTFRPRIHNLIYDELIRKGCD